MDDYAYGKPIKTGQISGAELGMMTFTSSFAQFITSLRL